MAIVEQKDAMTQRMGKRVMTAPLSAYLKQMAEQLGYVPIVPVKMVLAKATGYGESLTTVVHASSLGSATEQAMVRWMQTHPEIAALSPVSAISAAAVVGLRSFVPGAN